MSTDTPRSRRRLPHLGMRSEPPLYESGDYTIPDPLDALLTPTEELFMPTDFDDGEPTTITRHRRR